ncbi:Type II secretion system protein GspC N-terminal domain-containing protein [Cupriavidus oxalaticus]|uniref:type II secretion system protein N n=1 Tax=Cupriavidus oxalaticus TaxID=96344 RepID=UPI003F73C3EA
MQLSLRPVLRFNAHAPWLPRLASVALFVALCALATYWVLTFSAMRTLPVPQSARVAQTEAVETGAVATLFGGSAQGGPRDVQLLGVVAEVNGGAGAAIVSMDGGPPKAVRSGAELSQQIRLVEIRQRSVVIERSGVRQEIALPVQAGAVRAPAAGAPAPALPTPPAGAAAPMATPMPPAGAAAPMATPMPPPAPVASQPTQAAQAAQPTQPTQAAPGQPPQPQVQSQSQAQPAAQHQPMMAPPPSQDGMLVPKN